MENQMLQWALTANAVSRPAQWFVALFSVTPGETGGGTELTQAGYARQAVSWVVTGSQGSNNADLVFNSAADWPPITSVGVFDALTNGNLMWYGPLAAVRDPASGDTIRFAAGQLILELD